jgi:hypothetical protein
MYEAVIFIAGVIAGFIAGIVLMRALMDIADETASFLRGEEVGRGPSTFG